MPYDWFKHRRIGCEFYAWAVYKEDIKEAFLRTGKEYSDIYVRPPKEKKSATRICSSYIRIWIVQSQRKMEKTV